MELRELGSEECRCPNVACQLNEDAQMEERTQIRLCQELQHQEGGRCERQGNILERKTSQVVWTHAEKGTG